jgi:hypothetical protein
VAIATRKQIKTTIRGTLVSESAKRLVWRCSDGTRDTWRRVGGGRVELGEVDSMELVVSEKGAER